MTKKYFRVEVKQKDKFVYSLPVHLRGTFLLWEMGYSLKDWLPKSTYYDHRQQLRKRGVNIAGLCPYR